MTLTPQKQLPVCSRREAWQHVENVWRTASASFAWLARWERILRVVVLRNECDLTRNNRWNKRGREPVGAPCFASPRPAPPHFRNNNKLGPTTRHDDEHAAEHAAHNLLFVSTIQSYWRAGSNTGGSEPGRVGPGEPGEPRARRGNEFCYNYCYLRKLWRWLDLAQNFALILRTSLPNVTETKPPSHSTRVNTVS